MSQWCEVPHCRKSAGPCGIFCIRHRLQADRLLMDAVTSPLRWEYGKNHTCPVCDSSDIVMAAPAGRPAWKGGSLVLTCNGCGKQNTAEESSTAHERDGK